MIYWMSLLGLLPIILGVLLLGFFIGRLVKKRGNNPWLWGGATVLLLVVVSWQELPRLAGKFFIWEQLAAHSLFSTTQKKVADPNAIQRFTLRSQHNTKDIYHLSLPLRYGAEYSPEWLVRADLKYPSMEAQPDGFLHEGVITMYVTTLRGEIGRPSFYLSQVAAYPSLGEHVGKQNGYDVYQAKNPVTGVFDKTWLFSANDGQLVMVDSRVNDTHSAWRNISADLAIRYNFSSVLGNDFIKIDEAVVGFVKAHLKSQSIQLKENDK